MKGIFVAAIFLLSSIIATAQESGNDDQYRQILDKAILEKFGGAEVLVREHLYPPGWQAPRHYHDGDLFIYVISGTFEVVTDASGRVEFKPGQSVHMAADTMMDARNVSDAEPLKLVIFQIGESGKPFLVPIEKKQ